MARPGRPEMGFTESLVRSILQKEYDENAHYTILRPGEREGLTKVGEFTEPGRRGQLLWIYRRTGTQPAPKTANSLLGRLFGRNNDGQAQTQEEGQGD